MKLLVIGGSGLVGSHFLAEAKNRGIAALGTYRSHPAVDLVPLDLATPGAAAALIDIWKPSIVVHSAGWTWVDGCEKDPVRAMRENAEQPANLAQLCADRGIRIVYVSTSYVFDGKVGPYSETDIPRPINAYGRSKYAGEQAVMAIAGPLALIPRVICVWGKEMQGKNFVYQVLAAVREEKPMRIPSDQCGNPTWAGDICALVLDLLQAKESGIWHLGSEFPEWTREQWLLSLLCGLKARAEYAPMLEAWKYTSILTAVVGQTALRPLRAGLKIDRIRERFPRILRHPSDISCLF